MNKTLNLIQNNFKELPNNIEAEQSVIGSILTQNEIFDEITGIISDKIFLIHCTRKYLDLFKILFTKDYWQILLPLKIILKMKMMISMYLSI